MKTKTMSSYYVSIVNSKRKYGKRKHDVKQQKFFFITHTFTVLCDMRLKLLPQSIESMQIR